MITYTTDFQGLQYTDLNGRVVSIDKSDLTVYEKWLVIMGDQQTAEATNVANVNAYVASVVKAQLAVDQGKVVPPVLPMPVKQMVGDDGLHWIETFVSLPVVHYPPQQTGPYRIATPVSSDPIVDALARIEAKLDALIKRGA